MILCPWNHISLDQMIPFNETSCGLRSHTQCACPWKTLLPLDGALCRASLPSHTCPQLLLSSMPPWSPHTSAWAPAIGLADLLVSSVWHWISLPEEFLVFLPPSLPLWASESHLLPDSVSTQTLKDFLLYYLVQLTFIIFDGFRGRTLCSLQSHHQWWKN